MHVWNDGNITKTEKETSQFQVCQIQRECANLIHMRIHLKCHVRNLSGFAFV